MKGTTKIVYGPWYTVSPDGKNVHTLCVLLPPEEYEAFPVGTEVDITIKKTLPKPVIPVCPYCHKEMELQERSNAWDETFYAWICDCKDYGPPTVPILEEEEDD